MHLENTYPPLNCMCLFLVPFVLLLLPRQQSKYLKKHGDSKVCSETNDLKHYVQLVHTKLSHQKVANDIQAFEVLTAVKMMIKGGLLCCVPVWTFMQVPMFQRNIRPPSSVMEYIFAMNVIRKLQIVKYGFWKKSFEHFYSTGMELKKKCNVEQAIHNTVCINSLVSTTVLQKSQRTKRQFFFCKTKTHVPFI